MSSNYKKLGDYIQLINKRNTDLNVETLLGVSVQKVFIPSIANTVGTNFKNYKIVCINQFVYIADTSRRGDKIGLAMLEEYDEALVSQAYTVFDIVDKNKLHPEYLMMWFRRPEFDRYARYKSHGSVREIFDWEEMCEVELPIPSIEKQREIVKEYNTVTNRIKLNEQLNQKLEETAQALYRHWFVDNKDENWGFKKLCDLIDIQGGYSYKSEKLGKGNTFLLGMGCVSFTERFLEKGMRLYSDDVPKKHLIGSGEIIIATRQQTENYPILGAPSIIPYSLSDFRMVVASNLYRVKNKSNYTNRFIFQLLRSDDYKEHIKLNAKGTTVGMITKSDIENFEFKLPKNKVIFEFEKKLNPIVDRIEQCTLEIELFINLQSVLLSKMSKVEIEEKMV